MEASQRHSKSELLEFGTHSNSENNPESGAKLNPSEELRNNFPQTSSALSGSFVAFRERDLDYRVARGRGCLKLPRPAAYILDCRIARRRPCLKLPSPAAHSLN